MVTKRKSTKPNGDTSNKKLKLVTESKSSTKENIAAKPATSKTAKAKPSKAETAGPEKTATTKSKKLVDPATPTRKSDRERGDVRGALQRYEDHRDVLEEKKKAQKKTAIQLIPESTPINLLAPSKDKPKRRKKQDEAEGAMSTTGSSVPQYLVPPGSEPTLQLTAPNSRFGLSLGMSPRLNNWASYFKSSQPQADATSSTVPLKDSSSPNDQMPKDTHDQNKFNWDSNLDPSLAEFSTSHPPEKNTVRFGSTTFHPAEDAIKDPSDSSDRGGEDGEGGVDDGSDGSVAEVMDVIDGGDDESENHLDSTDDDIIMAYVELHLSKDPEWKKCAKMMSLPVKMPDVLRKYRLTKRLVDDLEDGTLTGDNVQYTIRRTHLCQALDVDELWIDDCLETLHYLDLYHEDSRVKHLLEDRKMKTGEPRIKLLNLLRSIQAASTIEETHEPNGHDIREDNRMDGSFNVVDAHHRKNRRPQPPEPNALDNVQQSYHPCDVDEDAPPNGGTPQDNNDPAPEASNSEASNSDEHTSASESEDIGTKEYNRKRAKRAKRHSKGTKKSKYTQLHTYPGQWRTVLEDGKHRIRAVVALKKGFMNRLDGLAEAEDCLAEAMAAHESDGGSVERGYYPRYKEFMKVLIFEDIATFRGELKSAARKVVRNQYKIFPPNGAKLTPEQYHQHVKNAVAELIKDGQFHMNGADNQGRTNNLSHPALEELCTSFYYGDKNRLAHQFPEEFKKTLSPRAMALAATALVCCLQEWQEGYMKARMFSSALYSSAYETIIRLIEKVKKDAYHCAKLENSLRDWAQGGSIQSGNMDDGSYDFAGFTVRLD